MNPIVFIVRVVPGALLILALSSCNGEDEAPSCGNGLLDPGELCDDGNFDDSDQCTSVCRPPSCDDGIVSGDESDVDCGGSCGPCGQEASCTAPADCATGACIEERCAYAESCAQLRQLDPELADGSYTIDPDGVDGSAEFPVFCDMSTAGGGWTLVERSPLGPDSVGVALYRDLAINAANPEAASHRLDRPKMSAIAAAATSMRVDCRGSDYLMTAADNLFAGEAGSDGQDTCANFGPVLYQEAQLKGQSLANVTLCTRFVGRSQGCAGAWSIDEHEQNDDCKLVDYPWSGEPITSSSADAFATDAMGLDFESPVHDCHKPGAVRWVMLR